MTTDKDEAMTQPIERPSTNVSADSCERWIEDLPIDEHMALPEPQRQTGVLYAEKAWAAGVEWLWGYVQPSLDNLATAEREATTHAETRALDLLDSAIKRSALDKAEVALLEEVRSRFVAEKHWSLLTQARDKAERISKLNDVARRELDRQETGMRDALRAVPAGSKAAQILTRYIDDPHGLMAAISHSEGDTLHTTDARICGYCLAGEGQECHTPGCLFWMADVVRPNGAPLREKLANGGATVSAVGRGSE